MSLCVFVRLCSAMLDHWRFKFVAFGWAQQEAYGVGVPLPDDVSCLLGPTYGV